MKILYYDCFAGISGDMNLAALIDLGVDMEKLDNELGKLGLDGWVLELSHESRGGIFGTQVNVITDAHTACDCKNHKHKHSEHKHDHSCNCDHSHHKHHDCDCDGAHHHKSSACEHRTFLDIKKIIEASSLSKFVKTTSISIFKNLAEAEGRVHNKLPDEVHFHEVGAVDSIVDIVGAAICVELLGVEKIVSGVVELGGGTVKCEHGLMPVPAPATAILAEKFHSKLGGANHECTTPTGAAIIATLCASFNPKISGKILKTGIGVGHRASAELANVLRVMLIEENFESSAEFTEEILHLISTNIDDMDAEAISFLMTKLFDAGALDAWQESIVMKKGRLAVKICALVNDENFSAVRDCVFTHSTSLGVREETLKRSSLKREIVVFKTSFGNVRYKLSKFKKQSRVKIEFEDLKRISDEKNIPLLELEKKLLAEFSKQ